MPWAGMRENARRPMPGSWSSAGTSFSTTMSTRSWLVWRRFGRIPEAYLVYLDDEGNERHRVKPFLASVHWVEEYVKSRVAVIARHLLEHGDMPRIPDKHYCSHCEFRGKCGGWRR